MVIPVLKRSRGFNSINRGNGQIHRYTGLFPIIEEASSRSHAVELRGVLAALPTGEDRCFRAPRLVYGARLFVIDDVVYNGHPSREDHLAYGYRAMSITIPSLTALRLLAAGRIDPR
jgi:hypothetical protein